jgi:preprotein translocase subunit SecF
MSKVTRREMRKMKLGGRIEGPIVPIKIKHEEEATPAHADKHRHYKNKFIKFYDKNMNKLQIFAFILLAFSIGVIIYTTITTGSIISRGISLTGGQIITVTDQNLNTDQVEKALIAKYPNGEISVRELSELGTANGVIIETDLDVDLQGVLAILKQWSPDIEGKYSVETIGSTLSSGFFSQVGLAIILAFVFMSIVVFLLFKTPAPSLAVILCSFSDIVFTIAMIDLFGIKLSTAGIAALLMLIGFSVDTDILLTTRLLKSGKGDYLDRTISAMKTGITMTMCIIATAIVGIIFAQSDVLRQIFTILLFGAIADIFFTYVTNTHLLWWYMEKKGLK